jgi:flagellar biosynthesis protein FliP
MLITAIIPILKKLKDNYKVLSIAGILVIFIIIGLYVKYLKHQINNYKIQYNNAQKKIKVLQNNLQQEMVKNITLEKQIKELAKQKEKVKIIYKQAQIEQDKIKDIPKNKARLSYDEQKKVINILNDVFSDF